MLIFSQRLKIKNLFEKWCEENDIPAIPFNMTAFLVTNKLLDEEKCLKFLEENQAELEVNL